MWLKTVDGDLVNMDQLARIGRYGLSGEVMLYAMAGHEGLRAVGAIDDATWQRLLAIYAMAPELERRVMEDRPHGKKGI